MAKQKYKKAVKEKVKWEPDRQVTKEEFKSINRGAWDEPEVSSWPIYGEEY